jgi:hypothetical protein
MVFWTVTVIYSGTHGTWLSPVVKKAPELLVHILVGLWFEWIQRVPGSDAGYQPLDIKQLRFLRCCTCEALTRIFYSCTSRVSDDLKVALSDVLKGMRRCWWLLTFLHCVFSLIIVLLAVLDSDDVSELRADRIWYVSCCFTWLLQVVLLRCCQSHLSRCGFHVSAIEGGCQLLQFRCLVLFAYRAIYTVESYVKQPDDTDDAPNWWGDDAIEICFYLLAGMMPIAMLIGRHLQWDGQTFKERPVARSWSERCQEVAGSCCRQDPLRARLLQDPAVVLPAGPYDHASRPQHSSSDVLLRYVLPYGALATFAVAAGLHKLSSSCSVYLSIPAVTSARLAANLLLLNLALLFLIGQQYVVRFLYALFGPLVRIIHRVAAHRVMAVVAMLFAAVHSIAWAVSIRRLCQLDKDSEEYQMFTHKTNLQSLCDMQWSAASVWTGQRTANKQRWRPSL